MKIGEKIKELRKKNDLTQEKLADYLCVSYQAVSKWETGVSSPDLSLIAPLTKLLHVSADELLGLTETEPDARRSEFETTYKKAWGSGDIDGRMKIAEAAVNEYPGDFKYLFWLANTKYYLAFEQHDFDADLDAEIEKVIDLYEIIIEDCTDIEVRNDALVGIVISLSWLHRFEEAKKYAELYPVEKSLKRDDLMMFCLTGDERVRHRQKMILSRLEALDNCLYLHEDLNARKTAVKIIDLIIPDGNYLNLHGSLFNNISGQAESLAREGLYNEAIAALEKAYYHVCEYDKIAFEDRKVYKYTAPLIDHVECDTREWLISGPGTIVDNFYTCLKHNAFDPLRDREDFKKLVEKK